MKGQYVIVRADRAGVFFGKLEEKNGQEVTMSDVRKLHYWNGAAAVEEISQIGFMTINEFINLTIDQYGGNVIKLLKEKYEGMI